MKFSFDQPTAVVEQEKIIPVHEEWIGLQKYKFEVGEQELEKWNTQVTEIHQALINKDFDTLTSLLKNDKLVERSKKLLERSQFLNPETQNHIKDLLAISVWIIDNQNHWPGNVTSGFRLIKGGLQRLESFTQGGGDLGPSCLDSCAIIEALSEKRGISGDIERLGKKGRGSRFEHRYWRSDQGFVVDTLWGIDIGGVYLSDEEYEARRQARAEERKAGRVIGSYNPSQKEDCIEDYTDKDSEAKQTA